MRGKMVDLQWGAGGVIFRGSVPGKPRNSPSSRSSEATAANANPNRGSNVSESQAFATQAPNDESGHDENEWSVIPRSSFPQPD